MIGNRIKELRMKKGVTQEALADVLHISSQAVSKWELGIASPDICLLVPLADYFAVTVDYLLREEWQHKTIDQSFWEITLDGQKNGIVSGTIKNVSILNFDFFEYEVLFLDKNGEMVDYKQKCAYDFPPRYSQHIFARSFSKKAVDTKIRVTDYKVKC